MSIRNALLSAAILAAIAGPASAQQEITKRATVESDATIEVSNVRGASTSRPGIATRSNSSPSSRTARTSWNSRRRRVTCASRSIARTADYHDDEDDAILTLHVPQGARLIIDTVSADIVDRRRAGRADPRVGER